MALRSSLRLAIRAGGISGPGAWFSLPVTKCRFEVPPAIENAFDEHGSVRDDERDSDAPLESGHA